MTPSNRTSIKHSSTLALQSNRRCAGQNLGNGLGQLDRVFAYARDEAGLMCATDAGEVELTGATDPDVVFGVERVHQIQAK